MKQVFIQRTKIGAQFEPNEIIMTAIKEDKVICLKNYRKPFDKFRQLLVRGEGKWVRRFEWALLRLGRGLVEESRGAVM